MAALLTCPDVQVLKRFVLGLDAGGDRDATAEHVEKCSKCMAALKSISSTDTLVEAVRAQETVRDGPEQAAVKQLAAKVRALLPEAKKHANPSPIRDAAMLTISCSSCKKKLRVTESVLGKKAKCPSCGNLTIVPTPASVGGIQEAPTIAPAPIPDGRTLLPSQPDASNVPTDSQAAKPDPTIATGTENSGHDPALTDFLAPAQNPDELGRLGKYRILKVLGHGGMGVVFLGEDATLGRKVAVKVMLPHLAQSRSSQQRFLREAKTAATLEHDNIVPIFHVDEDRGAPYIVMPLLKGQPLDERLKSDEPLPLADILRISRETARGLDAAHRTGLIHRDIKPANIWLEAIQEGDEGKEGEFTAKAPRPTPVSSRVKILDFGLARASADESGLTQQGAVIGTPAFMAPEQGRGAQVDARCDLFSLGVVMYRMCTGDLPFKGTDTVSTLMAVAMHDPAAPSAMKTDVPSELSDLVMGLLEKDPDKRITSASEVVKRIRAIERKLVIQQIADGDGDGDGESFGGSVDIKLPAKEKASAKPKKDAGSRRRAPLVFGIGAVAALLLLTCGAGGAFWLFQVIIVRDRDGKKIAEIQVPKDGKIEIVPNPVSTGPWKPTAEQTEFLNFAGNLPMAERRTAVDTKMRDLNAEGVYHSGNYYRPVLEPNEGPPSAAKYNLGGSEGCTFEVWPLVAFPSLTSVDLMGTGVKDFRPLAALPLTELNLNLAIDNLDSEQMLQSIKTLKTINRVPAAEYWGTRATIRAEIDQLAARAKNLSLDERKLSFIALMKKLHPNYTGDRTWLTFDAKVGRTILHGEGPVFDLSPVRAIEVTELQWEGENVVDLTPLAKTRTTHLSLSAAYNLRDLGPLADLPLKELHLHGARRIKDIRPLAKTKLEAFTCGYYNPNGGWRCLSLLKDISPLKGMPLKSVRLQFVEVSDLAPLAGTKLTELRCTGTLVTDLSLLKGQPLQILETGPAPAGNMGWWGAAIADLTPVEGMPLKEFSGNPRLYCERDETLLRKLPLQKINGGPAANFWTQRDAELKKNQDFAAATAKLTPDKAVEAVTAEVKRHQATLKDCRIEGDHVVETTIQLGNPFNSPFHFLRAFPKLRKVNVDLNSQKHIDFSALQILPIEDITCSAELIAFNRPILRNMPTLKTINGKPAQEVLGK